MTSRSKLQDKVAIVTGAGRGIGRAIALKLASDGAHIVLNDLDPGPAEETADAIRALGCRAVLVPGDLTRSDVPDTIVRAAVAELGGLDIIINNAGYSWDGVIQKTTDEQFDAMLDIHVKAPFRLLRAASGAIRDFAKQELAAGRGVNRKVVNISSIGGLFGNAGQVGYASGKTALVGLTKTLAKEWGRYRVNVNCVAFGLIETRMTEAAEPGVFKQHQVGERTVAMGVPQEFLDGMRKAIPLGRTGTPEDAAGAVYLFCIPESDYITGEIIIVSGGLVI
jgi:3-oxoacyl-[acyl-carrier protein] reductase